MRRLLKNLLLDRSADDRESDRTPVSFDDVLIRELDTPTVIDLDSDIQPSSRVSGHPDGHPGTRSGTAGPNRADGEPIAEMVDSTVQENDRLRAELLPGTVEPEGGIGLAGGVAETYERAPQIRSSQFDRVQQPTGANRRVAGFQQTDFWDRYDEAAAAANLFSLPPAAVTVVIGPLDVAVGVARRCRDNHWMADCDVFVLTEQPVVEAEPSWTTVRRPSDVVAVLEGGESDFPLIVLDIQRELPAWVRPLVIRLRQSGVGLVHYVLDDDPSDEDLATWHGELGRPSVLDLAAHVAPERVLELLDRGEPIASVAGMPISTELLLALRLGIG